MLDLNTRDRLSKVSYQKPAWSEFQADCNGVERTLEKVRTYLNLQKEI